MTLIKDLFLNKGFFILKISYVVLFSICKLTLDKILIKSVSTITTAIMHSGSLPGFIHLESK